MTPPGWTTISVDNDPRVSPDVLADVREWQYQGERPDLIWASPPCTEFSREFFPWTRTGRSPDMSIYLACRKIIDASRPRWWIIENTRGAVPYFGPYQAVFYPYYLWGRFPPLGRVDLIGRRHKDSYASTAKAERAKIPYALSRAVAHAIANHQLALSI